jgi:hypothetical protein
VRVMGLRAAVAVFPGKFTNQTDPHSGSFLRRVSHLVSRRRTCAGTLW